MEKLFVQIKLIYFVLKCYNLSMFSTFIFCRNYAITVNVLI